MKKKIITVLFCLNIYILSISAASLIWDDAGPKYVQYLTVTGKTGFITTPTAFCAPMGTLAPGFEFTFGTQSPYARAAILKLTYTPVSVFEFGFSKELAYTDTPNEPTNFYFDSTPFFFHYKFRMLCWETGMGPGAVSIGQDVEVVPDNSGGASRGLNSTTVYVVFTGATKMFGSFNFGFGKTLYLAPNNYQDALLNFFASWIYSFAQLDDRLQLLIDFSNADYRAGESSFKLANEWRAYFNFQIRGVLIKTERFQWTMMFTLYDLFDLQGAAPTYVNLNASLGTSFHIDLY